MKTTYEPTIRHLAMLLCNAILGRGNNPEDAIWRITIASHANELDRILHLKQPEDVGHTPPLVCVGTECVISWDEQIALNRVRYAALNCPSDQLMIWSHKGQQDLVMVLGILRQLIPEAFGERSRFPNAEQFGAQ